HVAARHHHRGALVGERAGGDLAQPAVGAGHHEGAAVLIREVTRLPSHAGHTIGDNTGPDTGDLRPCTRRRSALGNVSAACDAGSSSAIFGPSRRFDVRNSPFFDGVAQADLTAGGQPVKVPVFYYDGTA